VQEDVRSFVRMMGVDRFSRGDLAALQEVADLHFQTPTNLASVLWQNGLLGYLDEFGQRRFYSMGDVEQFHFPPDVDAYVLHPCLTYAVGGIKHVRDDSAGKGNARRTRRLPAAERRAAPDATLRSPGAQALAEPGPAEARSALATATAGYAVGDVLDDRFEILQVLGQGGFSKVYRVRDDVEGKERALKIFNTAAGYEAVRREIGALREIRHPNVVEVFWAGQSSAGDWYLVTEFIDGESLEEFVTGRRNLRDREAVDVALDLLEALVAFHPDGLIHRDIKPRNVVLTRSGAKLLDFNIASRSGDTVHTQSGTPPYQPPDADFARWDVSTDLFAVGVLLYQLLCNGNHPYPNAMPLVDAMVTDARAFRSDLGHDLAEFLVKASAPASRDRFTTADEMRLALRSIRDHL
jgi:predicted Ser/Thr protein kinase